MKRLLMTSALLSLLTACGGDSEELQQWMEQQRKEAKPTVTPLLPPKKFLPQPYEANVGVDPFSTQKLSVAVRQEAAQPNSLLTAEINRRKEPLEAYPLDNMSMVGSRRSPRPKSVCGKSSRTLRASGPSAPVPSSYRRRDDEDIAGEQVDGS